MFLRLILVVTLCFSTCQSQYYPYETLTRSEHRNQNFFDPNWVSDVEIPPVKMDVLTPDLKRPEQKTRLCCQYEKLFDDTSRLIDPNAGSPDWMDKMSRRVSWIGIIFFFASLLVLCLLPQRRNHRVIFLMRHVFCLSVSNSALIYIKSSLLKIEYDGNTIEERKNIANMVHNCFFLASVSWMTIISLDIRLSFWKIDYPPAVMLPFKQTGSIIYTIYNWGSTLEQNKRSFLYYTILGWGPSLLYGLVLSDHVIRDIHGPLSNVGEPFIWILLCSTTIVLLVVWKIRTYIKNNANLDQGTFDQHHSDDELRYTFYIKVFVLASIFWAFEIVFLFFHRDVPKILWFIQNCILDLGGLALFGLIITDREVRQSVLRRYRHKTQIPQSENTIEEMS